MRYARWIGLVVLAALVVGSLSGCSMLADKVAEKATEKAIEGATGNKVDIKENGISIEGTGGASAEFGEDVKVPDDFPKDVPVYDGKLAAALSGDGSWTLSIESNDDAQKILDFYTEKLDGEGWTKISSLTTEDGGMYSAKKDTRVVQVVATTGSGNENAKTVISVAVNTD